MGLVAPPSGCDNPAGGGGGGSGTVTIVTGTAPNVIITGAPSISPNVEAGTQSWQFSGFLTTPTLANIQNDYTQAGMDDIVDLRVDANIFDPPFFTGIAGGAQGRILIIRNISQTPIYFLHDSASSAAANRILSPRFVAPETAWALPINGIALFDYDHIDQRWRVIGNYIYDVTDTGNLVVTVSDDGQGGRIVGFNGVYTDGVTITGNGLPGSPLVANVSTTLDINDTIFVDEQYGNDGTATVDSLVNKFQTLPAALAAWTSGKTIHCFPGIYTLSSTFTVTDVLKIYLEPGAKIITNTAPAFSLSPGQFLWIDGEGECDLDSSLFINSTPSSAAIPEVRVNAKALNCTGAGQIIGDISSMKYSIRTDFIGDGGFEGSGWSQGFVACDVWRKSVGSVVRFNTLEDNDGQILVGQFGPRLCTIKGNNAERCQFENLTQVGNAIYTEACRLENWTSNIYLNVDFRSTDGFFMNHGHGTIYHDGNLYHSKTDTAGNEVPWYWCDQTVEAAYKPKFIHVRGNYVSATDLSFAGSQNNEFFTINYLCDIVLNGFYQNSGENTGLGAWPILLARNASTEAGETTITLNGDFKSMGGDISPIVFDDQSNPDHTFKWIVKNTAIQTGADYSIDTDVDMRIYVYHSLVMNVNYNPLISDGLSEDRTIVDTNITVDVPGYGI